MSRNANLSNASSSLTGSSQADPRSLKSEDKTARGPNPFADEYAKTPDAAARVEDPSAVFERLKLQEFGDDYSSVDVDLTSGRDRGAAWLRDQKERTIRNMLGALPEPSVSDEGSLVVDEDAQLSGELALHRDRRGKYYYSYTSAGSSSLSHTRDSFGYEDGNAVSNVDSESIVEDDTVPIIESDPNRSGKPRPTSRHLNWLASQQIPQSAVRSAPPETLYVDPDRPPDIHSNYADTSIPPELLQHLPVSPPPLSAITDCSECGVFLDSIRYVCSTCGEKAPVASRKADAGKGKEKILLNDNGFSYPPKSYPHYPYSSSPPMTSSSRTLVGSPEARFMPHTERRPLPFLSSPYSSQSTLSVPGPQSHSRETGYELCSGCIESAGVTHAIEAGLAPGTSPTVGNMSPHSPEDAQRALQWRRSAPKKGQLRHAYREKVWGHGGWEDVGACLTEILQIRYVTHSKESSEQDDKHTRRCSTCAVTMTQKRYKCASCQNFNLCRACYR